MGDIIQKKIQHDEKNNQAPDWEDVGFEPLPEKPDQDFEIDEQIDAEFLSKEFKDSVKSTAGAAAGKVAKNSIGKVDTTAIKKNMQALWNKKYPSFKSMFTITDEHTKNWMYKYCPWLAPLFAKIEPLWSLKEPSPDKLTLPPTEKGGKRKRAVPYFHKLR